MKDFFISYNSADKAWAVWIAWQLEEAKYTTKLQAWDFLPGGNFALEMDKAVKESKRTIAVLSPDYLSARFTKPEWAAAFVQDPTGEKGILLPVRIRECDVTGLLSPIVYIDLFNLDEESAKEELLKGVRRKRLKPTTEPLFPGGIQRSVTHQPRFPGALPSVWNVPHNRNPNFTGRQDILTNLHKTLASEKSITLNQVMHGLGGVGKTQIALEYAYRHNPEYEIVWWVRAEEGTTLASDYAALVEPLNLPQKDEKEQEIIVKAVRHKLGQRSNWLLIFDNANNPLNLKAYLPQGGAGHVLITSRNPSWRGIASILSVEVMNREESVDFLCKRTDQDDKVAASHLAEAVGDLPLALEQTGAYIEETGIALSDYLTLFRNYHEELLKRGPHPLDYPDTVATTWHLSFEKVKEASQAAVELLKLCAFLAPDDIPLELLNKGAQYLPQSFAKAVTNPLELRETAAILRRYSLVEVSKDALSIHRLVQAVIKAEMEDAMRRQWAERTVKVVTDSYPNAEFSTWFLCERLLPHAQACVSLIEKWGFEFEEAAFLLNRSGYYLYDRARYSEAEALYERALAIRKKTLGEEHPDVATSVPSHLILSKNPHFSHILLDLGYNLPL